MDPILELYSASRDIASLNQKVKDGLTSEKIAAITAAAARRQGIFCSSSFLPSIPSSFEETIRRTRVCLITAEIASAGSSGGIGAAFLELAKLLADCDSIDLTVLYANHWEAGQAKVRNSLSAISEQYRVHIEVYDPTLYVTPPFTPEKLSYGVLQWMLSHKQGELGEACWDIVHFHDYKGLGYYPTLYNRQKPRAIAGKIILQTHGPTRWALEANNKFWSHEEQLVTDFLEKKSIEYCDHLISPSRYLIDWFNDNKWILAGGDQRQVSVLQNPRTPIASNASQSSDSCPDVIREIVFFGRHEERKGLPFFMSAINKLIQSEITFSDITITVLGGLGDIGDAPSLICLREATRGWSNLDFRLITNYNRPEATAYLANNGHEKLVCICSPYENSPYTVVEAIEAGCKVIMSDAGGSKELIDIESGFKGIISMDAESLSAAIQDAICNPSLYKAAFRYTTEDIRSTWQEIHALGSTPCQNGLAVQTPYHQAASCNHLPLVSFIITHFQRPLKLLEAVASALLQTYPRLEIIVVDDGSDLQALELVKHKVKPLLDLCDGKLIFRENGYLGAARNSGLGQATGDFVVFMDDDDIAMPDLVATLVESAINSSSDITVALNTYMPVSCRDHWRIKRFAKDYPLPSYIPIGHIESLAPLHNLYGGCTSLIKTSAIRGIGGYTELRDVGHEDYELYARLVGAGASLMVHPEVLYLYETDRPSMLSKTTLWKNFSRSIKAHSIKDEMLDLILCRKGQAIIDARESRLAWILQGDPAVGILRVWPQNDDSINFMADLLMGDPECKVLYQALKREN